jgi:hypothetical protein
MYRLMMALIVLIVTPIASVSTAQEATADEIPWSVFLLEQNAPSIVEITSNQEVTTYPLDVFGGNSPTLSTNGTAVANCTMSGRVIAYGS